MRDSDLLVATIVAFYHDLHRELREVLADLDTDALNWSPGPDTNSIGVLVVHLLASEVEMLYSVCGLPNERDRPAEFATRTHTAADLLLHIETVEAALEHLGQNISDDDLRALRTSPNKPTPRPGFLWLVTNYGHAREHRAHIQLTKQIYDLTHGAGKQYIKAPTGWPVTLGFR
jgi:hypothetical protein